MFRQNDRHQQPSFIDGLAWMPEKLSERLRTSWAGTFYSEVLCRIDETLFAVLYSTEVSRPNAPLNVLVSFEILKSGFGWSDEETYEQVCYNLQVRHALGLGDLRAELFTLRTVYNFRQRVRTYAEETGINLLQRVFEQVTDAQLAAVQLKTGWQRMDSTQVLSNLAHWSRLELVVGVLQKVYQQLPEALQTQWEERLAAYRRGRPHQVCYRIKASEQEQHLQTLGELLQALAVELEQTAAQHPALALLQRVLAEQFVLDAARCLTVRPAAEVASDSLQSPYDPDATYRVKSGQRYRGGYVVNVSETADPANPVQLLTDVQVEPNQTDDAQLLQQALDGQAERGVEVKQVTTDGGYTGPTGEAACATHQVELRATRMRGGKSTGTRWGWEKYAWEQDAEGTPVQVTCPQGVTAALCPGRREGRFQARFPRASCEACPLVTQCRVQLRAGPGPSLYVTRQAMAAAIQRQRLCPADTSIRAVVEATVREVKHPFPGGKLPVRGLTRVRMVIYGSALMVNLRRLHKHFADQLVQAHSKPLVLDASAPFSRLCAWLTNLLHCFAPLGRRRALVSIGV
jgi:hypothetical protein